MSRNSGSTRICGISRARSSLVSAKDGSPAWVMTFILKPRPSLDWQQLFEAIAWQAERDGRSSFSYLLDAGPHRSYRDFVRPGWIKRARRFLREVTERHHPVTVSVTCGPSDLQAQRAHAEAQQFVEWVNIEYRRTEAERTETARAQAEEVARLASSVDALDRRARRSARRSFWRRARGRIGVVEQRVTTRPS